MRQHFECIIGSDRTCDVINSCFCCFVLICCFCFVLFYERTLTFLELFNKKLYYRRNRVRFLWSHEVKHKLEKYVVDREIKNRHKNVKLRTEQNIVYYDYEKYILRFIYELLDRHLQFWYFWFAALLFDFSLYCYCLLLSSWYHYRICKHCKVWKIFPFIQNGAYARGHEVHNWIFPVNGPEQKEVLMFQEIPNSSNKY